MELDPKGELISSGEGRFRWIIDDFFSRFNTDTFISLHSPAISFCGALFILNLACRQGHLNLDLCEKCYSRTLPKPKVKIGMIAGYREEWENWSGEVSSSGSFTCRMRTPWSEMRSRCEIVRKGCLTIFIEFRRSDGDASGQRNRRKEAAVRKKKACESDSDEEEAFLNRRVFKKMRRDLKSLLDSGEDCDVTIKVQKKEFRAHRVILRARSPVFKSMFTHETVEKRSGVVTIEDCDPDIFSDFLNYLYTGSTNYICDENVRQLYVVADKYCVGELKNACAVFMDSILSIDNFCDIYMWARRYNETVLVDSSTEFYCANAREIVKTAKWLTFLQENTAVGNELIVKHFARKERAS